MIVKQIGNQEGGVEDKIRFKDSRIAEMKGVDYRLLLESFQGVTLSHWN
jgi:hypothetical protein